MKRNDAFDKWFAETYGKDPLPTDDQVIAAAAASIKWTHHNEWIERKRECRRTWDACKRSNSIKPERAAVELEGGF